MEILLIIFIVLIIIYYSIDYYLNKYKYNQYLIELEIYSKSKRTNYFTQASLKLIHKEYISIEILEFYKELDNYYSNTDLFHLIEHRKSYIKNKPESVELINLYNTLVHMKTKDFIFNIKP